MAWAIKCIKASRDDLTALNDAGEKLWEPFQVENYPIGSGTDAGGRVLVWMKREFWFDNSDPPVRVDKDNNPLPN